MWAVTCTYGQEFVYERTQSGIAMYRIQRSCLGTSEGRSGGVYELWGRYSILIFVERGHSWHAAGSSTADFRVRSFAKYLTEGRFPLGLLSVGVHLADE